MATITVTNENDSGAGSLRAAIAAASAGDIINFAPSVTDINLTSSLVISKNVIIDGLLPGSTNPDVTINGGGASSNFADFTINAGVTATLEGLIIAGGRATGTAGTGAAGHYHSAYGAGGGGGGAAGGIYDAGVLTLTNSLLFDDTATGGTGGAGYTAVVNKLGGNQNSVAVGSGGGAGGNAAGAIYVAQTGTLNYSATDSFSSDSATGGTGGQGGGGSANNPLAHGGGLGGAGGVATNGASAGNAGQHGYSSSGGAGGAAGLPGQSSGPVEIINSGGNNIVYLTPSGGGGGGTAFAEIGGKGTVNILSGVVTNSSDDINTIGSLRYELAHIVSGGTITFDPSVTTIDLASSLVIAKNVTIEGAQSAVTGAPGVTINGGGSASNFADFTLDAGVSATIDGLIIADGHATGATGSPGTITDHGGIGGGAAGGIYDAGSLTLTNSVLQNDTATGGTGGTGHQAAFESHYATGGGAGGTAAGGIYVAQGGTLDLAASDAFNTDSARGGTGGQGGDGNGSKPFIEPGGGGGPGGYALDGGVGSPGTPGQAGQFGGFKGAGGPPGEPGHSGFQLQGSYSGINFNYFTSAGGGGGGTAFLPVCIKADALGKNVPRRDLWISPHHAMYLDGVLIEAKDLVNGVSIVQAERVEKLEYFHVELDTHDVIIAEGALSETYLDDDNRLLFHNASDYYALYSDASVAASHYCAPRLEDGYEVEAVRQRIAARASLLRNANGKRPYVSVHRRAARA